MSPKKDRRAVTLSISMTPELSSEVASRVESGLYTSASELLREALRLLIRTEASRGRAPQAPVDDDSLSTARFAVASELMDLGSEMQAEKIRLANPELSHAEVLARLAELAEQQEAGPGLRVAPDRLSKLKLK